MAAFYFVIFSNICLFFDNFTLAEASGVVFVDNAENTLYATEVLNLLTGFKNGTDSYSNNVECCIDSDYYHSCSSEDNDNNPHCIEEVIIDSPSRLSAKGQNKAAYRPRPNLILLHMSECF